MTKQEEIREGTESILKTMLRAVSNTGSASPRTYTEMLQNYQHSQGVVIKGERELPDWLMEGQEAFDNKQIVDRFKQAGIVAVEPLIKKGRR